MRISFSLIALVVFLSGCSIQQRGTQVTPVNLPPRSTPTAAQTSPTSGPTESSTSSVFQIEDLNPINRVVVLSELDLKPTTRVLAFDPVAERILSISGESINLIANKPPKANIPLDGIKVSPDHRWFAYLEINNGFNIWISSVDGSQNYMGLANAVGSSFRWLSNDKIAVYNKSGAWTDCPSEMQIFDPFTQEVNEIAPISTQGSAYCFPIPYFNPNLSQALYLNSSTGWEVYDYETQTSYSVLPELDTSPSSNKYFLHWGKDGLSFVIPYSDKLTFAFELPEAEFTSKRDINSISLPNNTVNENAILTFWDPEKELAGLDLIGANHKAVLDCDVAQTFAMINLATQKLKNYCLNRSLYFEQIGTPWFMYTSADYRFVGWTVRELPSNAEPLGIVILDTETGKLSYLEGYELLGFGESER